ncbi:MAG: YkgJ family cysteine cluster protein [Planctomycetes bacterium]|nr:YkgJ family cysteine cluster protein [Planctomycetota bacterium]MCW8134070.1 YkgJ family cysteine cluster protein [Planctomycetota bacterium]
MADQTHPLIEQLKQVCAQADAEFERGRRVHGARILCAAGCSSCCSQIFQITEVEAARISQHVATLPEAERAALQARARENLRRRNWLFNDNERWGDSLASGGNPCPALTSKGACGMYDARPIMCRKFGVPIFNPDKPASVMACELNFKPGDEIEDAELVEQQTALYRAQQDLQADWNGMRGGRDDKPWSIARAIVEDATKFLP